MTLRDRLHPTRAELLKAAEAAFRRAVATGEIPHVSHVDVVLARLEGAKEELEALIAQLRKWRGKL